MIFSRSTSTFDLDRNSLRLRSAKPYVRLFAPTQSITHEGMRLAPSVSAYTTQIFFWASLVIAAPETGLG